MRSNDDHEFRGSRPTFDGLSVVALIFILALLFIAYFVMRVAAPDLPLHVYQALAWLPS
jgi:hypothetical protein